jgi:hypothetical protein
MRIILEDVEGAFYQDIILEPEDLEALKKGSVLEGETIAKSRRYYGGVRLGESWNVGKSEKTKKSIESHEGIFAWGTSHWLEAGPDCI